ncbi:MAG: methyltransferase domain-containing protein [Gammaproteobacteria bacterium]|nr:methyltransferase domain-containing protein [Gammaproteobacteria bacterium]MBT8151543.1 methyltransferase domain-containing protein [Gammaproteobacteria bacterium]NND39812.1 methyltransferase domain-containing protein [Pseudomonadales bacterium]NNM11142.1 methyltransferase domain-containing protein [Pseudomonadales bacterium]RZV56988.1 MAG: class I SAM-dependent methyltransferase [Pseudomonadales bacterium]
MTTTAAATSANTRRKPASKKKDKVKKPEIIEEMGVLRMTTKHPTIRKLKRKYPTSIHGNKFWSSSYLLMDYLTDNPPKKKHRILDLGCGWGLTSIYCAKKFGCKVTGVDADKEVFPYVDAHAELNGVEIDTLHRKFEKLDVETLSNFDIIIGGDICFWDSLNDTLFKLFKRAKKAGVKKAIIADPQRQPFVDLCDRLDDHFTHEVWDWELPEPTPANGDILVVKFNKS